LELDFFWHYYFFFKQKFEWSQFSCSGDAGVMTPYHLRRLLCLLSFLVVL
jgi:hypothetical protein